MESFVLYVCETERAYKARELLLFIDQNRIIISDNNSKEQLDRIIRTARFAEEWLTNQRVIHWTVEPIWNSDRRWFSKVYKG